MEYKVTEINILKPLNSEPGTEYFNRKKLLERVYEKGQITSALPSRKR
jgi:hypothetical protein